MKMVNRPLHKKQRFFFGLGVNCRINAHICIFLSDVQIWLKPYLHFPVRLDRFANSQRQWLLR